MDVMSFMLRTKPFSSRRGSSFDRRVKGAYNGLEATTTADVEDMLSSGPVVSTSSRVTSEPTPVDACGVSKPRVLVIHCGGTFGMMMGTGGQLQAGGALLTLSDACPELAGMARVDVHTAMNLDSSSLTPAHWVHIAQVVHDARSSFNGFVIIHGTDTMAYTGAALSFMLEGLGKPVILTGAQIPLSAGRTDARQNLVDAVMVASSGFIKEVAICFGGVVLRANRTTKMESCAYAAFESPNYPPLATLGARVEWNHDALLRPSPSMALYSNNNNNSNDNNNNDTGKNDDRKGLKGGYQPRMRVNPHVVRLPVVPGVPPGVAFGDLAARGVRGAVLEAFGVGNIPSGGGWAEWLSQQRAKGVAFYVGTQCPKGPLGLDLYSNGAADLLGTPLSSRRMTTESAVVKMMLCLEYPALDMHTPIAGEL